MLSPAPGPNGLFWSAGFRASNQTIRCAGVGPVFARTLRRLPVFARTPARVTFAPCARPHAYRQACFRPRAFLQFDQLVTEFPLRGASARRLAPTSVSARTPSGLALQHNRRPVAAAKERGFRAPFAAVGPGNLLHASLPVVCRQCTGRACPFAGSRRRSPLRAPLRPASVLCVIGRPG